MNNLLKWSMVVCILVALTILFGCEPEYNYEPQSEQDNDHWAEFCMDAFHGISWMCNTNFGWNSHEAWEENILPICEQHTRESWVYTFCYELHPESCELIIQCVERNGG